MHSKGTGGAWIARGLGSIGEDDDWKLKPLRFVDRHQFHRPLRTGEKLGLALANFPRAKIAEIAREGPEPRRARVREVGRDVDQLPHVARLLHAVGAGKQYRLKARLDQRVAQKGRQGHLDMLAKIANEFARLVQAKVLLLIGHGRRRIEGPGQSLIQTQLHEGLVLERADWTPEKTCQRGLVPRIEDALQKVPEIRDLLFLVEPRPLDNVRMDAKLSEGPGIGLNVRSAPEEHGDIAELRGPRAPEIRIEHKSASRTAECRDTPGDQFRLHAPHRVAVCAIRFFRDQKLHARLTHGVSVRLHALIAAVHLLQRTRLPEIVVNKSHDFRKRPIIHVKTNGLLHQVSGLTEHLNLRASKLVDRLLGVTDNKQLRPRTPRERHQTFRERELPRVCVLELVDKQILDTRGRPFAQRIVLSQHPHRFTQQVRKIQAGPFRLCLPERSFDLGIHGEQVTGELRRCGLSFRIKIDRLVFRKKGPELFLGLRKFFDDLLRGPIRLTSACRLQFLQTCEMPLDLLWLVAGLDRPQ